jgi:HEPN domain-containing protein
MPRREHAGLSEQRKASLHRLEDAQVLFNGGRWRGAMYMAGYAVECRLKYTLMRQWKCFTLIELEKRLDSRGLHQSLFTHNLETLLKVARGWQRLKQNFTLWTKFFNLINQWKPAWRYDPDPASRDEAEDFLTTTKEFLQWVENNL